MKRPERPEMNVTLPDFAQYQRVYRVTAVVPTARQPVTITATLSQLNDGYTFWKWQDDELTGERGGHTLRAGTQVRYLLQDARSFLRIDAAMALKAAGWHIDPLGTLWSAPLSVWMQTLKEIR